MNDLNEFLCVCSFPEIENPLPINVHIPPVTCTAYHTGVDEDLLCDLWYLASKATQEKRTSHQKVSDETNVFS